MTHDTREVEEVKQIARDIVQVVVDNWPEYHLMTGRERNNLFDGIKPILHHQLQKARVQEKMRIKTLLEDLPAFTPCSNKTMGKVADEAKKPAYLTNYLERETVLKLLTE